MATSISRSPLQRLAVWLMSKRASTFPLCGHVTQQLGSLYLARPPVCTVCVCLGCAWPSSLVLSRPAACSPDWCCKSIPRRSGRGCRDRFLCAPQPHHVSRSVLTLFALIAGYCTFFQGPRGPQMLLLPYPGPQVLRVFGSQSALQNQAGANVIPLSFIL